MKKRRCYQQRCLIWNIQHSPNFALSVVNSFQQLPVCTGIEIFSSQRPQHVGSDSPWGTATLSQGFYTGLKINICLKIFKKKCKTCDLKWNIFESLSNEQDSVSVRLKLLLNGDAKRHFMVPEWMTLWFVFLCSLFSILYSLAVESPVIFYSFGSPWLWN